MDNDRKVTDLAEQSKSVFLSDAIQDFQRRQKQYDLGEEFARTKKNRTYLVPGVIVGLVVAFTLAGGVLSARIERSSRVVEIDFEEFEQVDLRDVLMSWLSVEQRLDEVGDEIDRLEDEREELIGLARSDGERRIALLRLRDDLTGGQRALRIAGVQQQVAASVSEIESDYNARISGREDEAQELQRRQRDEFDPVEVEAALSRREVLDDQRRLFEIELDRQYDFFRERLAVLQDAYREETASISEFAEDVEHTLRDQYTAEIEQLVADHEREMEELTLRYNPDMGEEAIAVLFDQMHEVPDVLPAFDEALLRFGILTREEFALLRSEMAELQQIVDRLQQIPYLNSVPEALDQIEARASAVIARLEEVRVDAVDRLLAEEQRVAQTQDQLNEVRGERDEARRERDEAHRDAAAVRADLAEAERVAADALAAAEGKIAEERDRFLYALGQLIVEDREDGYIIDPRDPDRVYVYMNRIRDIEPGVSAFVFRDPEGLVATIEFVETDTGAYASVVETADDRSIRPFDRVLLDIAGADDMALRTVGGSEARRSGAQTE